MTRIVSLALLGLLTSIWTAPGLAASLPGCVQPQAIQFGRGASSATVSGPVLRGEDVCYTISAKAGQALSARVTSPNDNVEFQIYQPGYHVAPVGDGPEVSGATVKGAGSDDDARMVSVILPESGRYVFVLGTERGGGGEYRLRVSIRR